MKVPFIDLVAQHRELRGELEAVFAGVLDSGRFVGGPELTAFEAELAPVAGAKYAVGVSSGTDALLISLMALGVGAGDEVVTTPFTFFATAGVVERTGARTVFVDIEEESFNLDPTAAASAVTGATKVVMPVHLFGRPATLPEVGDVAIVEDACQAIGAAPVRGTTSALSFFPTKNLGAFGDGGAVLTNDEALAERLRVLRAQGGKPKYFHKVVGGNFRLDALQAALLRVKLRHLESRTYARRTNAARYRELFAAANVPAEVRLPVDTPEHIYNQFTLRTPRRDELRGHLKGAGIDCEIYYPLPLHLQEALAHLGYKKGSLPVAERAAAEVLSLPVHPMLTEAQQDHVVARVADFFAA